ncbi:magnesium transporter MgtE N-terminal domain-containing protein [Lacrimispora defluvii]|uniref:Magnesium transporter n=1 Tax=Lacrimispora defluvii TaxID=2719233 RepID=A0ABX1VUF6_9FIRM|nr:CBS domain-containing protein [Lacrimispora defluvii]NNJ32052.1 magnesium transporter [Lacrimispora defluvii]
MIETNTFYLSRVLGCKVVSPSGEMIGKVQDILVSVLNQKPQVIAIKVRSGNKSKILDFSNFKILKAKRQYVFKCNGNISIFEDTKENILYLKNNVLDRQLVDIDDRKLVRVNDLRLATLVSGTYVIAVDVGLEGLFRRLGVAKPIKLLLDLFHGTVPSKLILWNEVETVDFGHAGIKLSSPFSKLSTLHVSDLADIIEDMDAKMQTEIFASLDEEKAADVLEELDTDTQIHVIESMTIGKAADVLEKMPADEAADILDELEEEKAEEILLEMDREASEDVRELLKYEDDEVGSLMTTDFISFNKSMTVEAAITELRRLQPESDTIYYLYIVDEKERLIATVSLRDIIVSQPTTKLSEIMNTKSIYVTDTDSINSINDIVSKYSLLAVPVVDKEKIMLGMIIIDDIVYNLLKSSRRRM